MPRRTACSITTESGSAFLFIGSDACPDLDLIKIMHRTKHDRFVIIKAQSGMVSDYQD